MGTAFYHIDMGVLIWLQEHVRNAVLTPMMIGITSLGNIGLVWIVTSVVLLFFRKTRSTGLTCLLALLFSLLINNVLLKNMVCRVRPYDANPLLMPLIQRPTDFSFPSGHAASSFACAGVMWHKLPRRAGVPVLILAILISFSRLYIGVHYPTDVLAGVISGLLISFLAIRTVQGIRKLREKKKSQVQ